jgi:hypothetical protein
MCLTAARRGSANVIRPPGCIMEELMNRHLSLPGMIALIALPTLAFAHAPGDDNSPGSSPPAAAAPANPSQSAPQDDTTAESNKSMKAPSHGMARGNETSVERREVVALNTLEAQGYSEFKDMHPDGQNIAATAHKDGKDVQVEVTPSGDVQSK